MKTLQLVDVLYLAILIIIYEQYGNTVLKQMIGKGKLEFSQLSLSANLVGLGVASGISEAPCGMSLNGLGYIWTLNPSYRAPCPGSTSQTL